MSPRLRGPQPRSPPRWSGDAARDADDTLTARLRAIAACDERSSAAASALTALFQLAGEHELAARVRPLVSRPGQTEIDEEPVAPPVG